MRKTCRKSRNKKQLRRRCARGYTPKHGKARRASPVRLGGWQEMARRRYQKGSIRKHGKRNPVWELQWWEDILEPDGTIGRRRESAILGHRPQRHQLAPAGFKACGKAGRGALDKLAHLSPDPCHVAATGGRFGQRCSGTTRAFADHNHARNLHASGSRASAGGGRETVANGDER
jgi:hypothetical protein